MGAPTAHIAPLNMPCQSPEAIQRVCFAPSLTVPVGRVHIMLAEDTSASRLPPQTIHTGFAIDTRVHWRSVVTINCTIK